MTLRILIVLSAAAWFSQVAAQSAAPPAVPLTAPAASPPGAVPGQAPTDKTYVQPTMGDDKDAIEAAHKWLALLDTGNVGAAWDVASPHLKSVVKRQKWVTEISSARKPFGKFVSRKPEKFARAHSLPGAPEGDYSIIEFESVYANGKRATEQLIWVLEAGDVWRVSGYYIR